MIVTAVVAVGGDSVVVKTHPITMSSLFMKNFYHRFTTFS